MINWWFSTSPTETLRFYWPKPSLDGLSVEPKECSDLNCVKTALHWFVLGHGP